MVKKISRKEFKEDRFLNLFSRILVAASSRVGLLIGLLALVLLLGGTGFGVYLYYAREEKRALAMLEEANLIYLQIGPSRKTEGSENRAIEIYQSLINRYPNSRAAEEALLRLAYLYLQTSRFEKARVEFNRYLERYPRGRFVSFSWLGMAYAYEGEGNHLKSAEAFSRIVNDYPKGPLKGEAYMGLGRSYEFLGKKEQAIEVYNRLSTELSGSYYGEVARRRLAIIKGS